MELQKFLEAIPNASLTQPVYCLTAKSSPVLFLSKVRKALAKESSLQVIDLATTTEESLEGQLSMTFLGQRNRFWLHGFHELDAKQKKKIIALLNSYSGQNTVFITVDAAKASSNLEVVELPEKVNAQQYALLAPFIASFGPTNDAKPAKSSQPEIRLLKKFFALHQAASLDGIILLAEYGILLGARADDFLAEWLERIIEPDHSLFMLSTYFFGKKPKEFFSLWHSLKDLYPLPFWSSYFSEQLFRAYGYINYAKKQDFTKAKKIGYRLPFSFIQKDWRQVNPAALIQAHQAIYQADWHAKNSLHPYLDRVFLEFMLFKD